MIADLEALLAPLRENPWLPLLFMPAVLVAGALFVSVWLVILQAALLVEPPLSIAVALGGAVLSASVFFWLGRGALGPLVRRRTSRRVLDAVQGASLEHVVALRILPVLPFTGVNLAAGALGVAWRTYFVGTVLGMAPGVVATCLLGDRAVAVVKDPTPSSIAALVGAALVLVVVASALRRWARRTRG